MWRNTILLQRHGTECQEHNAGASTEQLGPHFAKHGQCKIGLKVLL